MGMGQHDDVTIWMGMGERDLLANDLDGIGNSDLSR